MVRALNELEVNGVALERAQEFTILPSEVHFCFFYIKLYSTVIQYTSKLVF